MSSHCVELVGVLSTKAAKTGGKIKRENSRGTFIPFLEETDFTNTLGKVEIISVSAWLPATRYPTTPVLCYLSMR